MSKRRGVLIENGKRILDPLSAHALEMALLTREQFGGEVFVMMLGKKKEEELLRSALAMGADRAVRVEPPQSNPDTSPEVEWVSGFVKVKILVRAIRKIGESFDLFLLGASSLERGFGEFPSRLAAALDVPFMLDVSKVAVSPPAVLGVGALSPKPRIPNALAVMKAGKKPLDVLTQEALGINELENWMQVQVVSRTYWPGGE